MSRIKIMSVVLALLFVALVILLILGLIAPSVGLFWYKKEKTRGKVGLFYGVSLIVCFIFMLIFAPETSNKTEQLTSTKDNEQKNATEQKSVTYEPSNKNVKKWLGLDEKKIEKYIKKQIEGQWNLSSTLTYITTEGKTESKFNNNPPKTSINFEEGGFFKTPKFNESRETKSGTKTNSGYYLLHDSNINFKTTSDDYNESVYFISENLLITKFRIDELGTVINGYNFYSKSNDYKEELSDLIKFELAKGYVQILAVTQNLNSSNAYKELLSAYKKLEFVSLLEPSLIDIKNDEVISETKKVLDGNFAQYKKQQLEKIEKEYNEIKTIKDFDIFKDLSDKVNELNTLKEISDAFGFDNKDIITLNKKLNKDYQKSYDEFAIYGKGEDYALKSASEYFLQENCKDPDSFEFVDGQIAGKNKKGLVYKVKFRGNNSFGAKVLNTATLVLRYDINQGVYNVVDAQF